MLVRITGKNFVAGAVIHNGRVIACAPIIRKWALHLTEHQLRKEIKARGLTATVVTLTDEDKPQS